MDYFEVQFLQCQFQNTLDWRGILKFKTPFHSEITLARGSVSLVIFVIITVNKQWIFVVIIIMDIILLFDYFILRVKAFWFTKFDRPLLKQKMLHSNRSGDNILGTKSPAASSMLFLSDPNCDTFFHAIKIHEEKYYINRRRAFFNHSKPFFFSF